MKENCHSFLINFFYKLHTAAMWSLIQHREKDLPSLGIHFAFFFYTTLATDLKNFSLGLRYHPALWKPEFTMVVITRLSNGC